MKVESIAECSPWSILQYFLPALSDNRILKTNFFSSFFERLHKTGFIVSSAVNIHMHPSMCQCVGKVYYPNVNLV